MSSKVDCDQLEFLSISIGSCEELLSSTFHLYKYSRAVNISIQYYHTILYSTTILYT